MGKFLQIVVLWVVALGLRAPAQLVDWPSIGLREVVTNRFLAPSAITHAGDGSGRLFVAEAPGKVWIVKDGTRLATPFLDISDRVGAEFGGQGLLSLAFPPGFGSKQYFFALYTSKSGALVLSRFDVTLNPDVGGVRTEEAVLTIPDRAARWFYRVKVME